jgi:hypothetical protein
MHRIEKALRPVERQEGGVDDLEELFVGPGAGGRVHPVDVDAAAMPLALRRREGTNISDERRCAVGAGLRLGMPATQHCRPRRRHSRAGLQHNTPADALGCGMFLAGCEVTVPLQFIDSRVTRSALFRSGPATGRAEANPRLLLFYERFLPSQRPVSHRWEVRW